MTVDRPTTLQRSRLERAAALKGDLVEFALTPPFQRLFREHMRRCARPGLDPEAQAGA
jgi:hypothetical protein